MAGGWKKWALGALVLFFVIKAPHTAGHLIEQAGHAAVAFFDSLNLH